MISIIVPVYNAEEFLIECLESIQRQTYRDFEVICINDGSKDESEKICKNFSGKDGRFRCISQSNQGVSAARNKGLDSAVGEYVCFIDSDDVVAPGFLETLVRNINDNDLVICDYTRTLSDLGIGSEFKKYEPNVLIHDIVFEQIKHPNIVCFLYKKDIIDNNRIRFTEGCIRNEDYEFYMSYLASCQRQILLLSYIGYYYRQNCNSAMSTLNRKSLTSLEATERIAVLLENKGLIEKKDIIISNGVLSFMYRTAIYRNKDLYDYILSHYDVSNAMRMMLKFPVFKKKLVAVVYLLMGKNLFYSLLSKTIVK